MIEIVEPLEYGAKAGQLLASNTSCQKDTRRIRMSAEESSENFIPAADVDESTDLSLNVGSVAIQRLIEEVRSSDSVATPANYNRTHNRHNR